MRVIEPTVESDLKAARGVARLDWQAIRLAIEDALLERIEKFGSATYW